MAMNAYIDPQLFDFQTIRRVSDIFRGDERLYRRTIVRLSNNKVSFGFENKKLRACFI